MTFPLARLMSAPDPSATVRYDFNDKDANAGRRVQADGFTLGAPSLLSAADAVSPLYGDRSLSFRHQIMGSRSDALSALAVLSRELLRPTNWFMFQLGGVDTRPTFWRLRATGPEALSFDRWYVDPPSGDPVPSRESSNAFEIDVALTAEAFGYGERITLGPYTVVQDAVGDNPMRVELPTIKGDAPTALRVSVTAGEFDLGGGGSEWLVAAITSAAEPDDVVVDIGVGDGWTGFDAPTSSAYPNTIGGTSRVASGGTAATILRTLPDLASGRYKAFLRYTASEGDGNVTVQTTLDPSGSGVDASAFNVELGVVVTPLNAVPSQGWIDLCDIAVPFGDPLPADVTTPPQSPRIALEVTAPVGVDVVIDALKLIPVSGPGVASTLLRTVTTSGIPLASGTQGAWDGDTEAYWVTNLEGTAVVNAQVSTMGGFPVVNPATGFNMLLVMAIATGLIDASIDPSITTVGAQTQVTASYHPRLLHLDGRP